MMTMTVGNAGANITFATTSMVTDARTLTVRPGIPTTRATIARGSTITDARTDIAIPETAILVVRK